MLSRTHSLDQINSLIGPIDTLLVPQGMEYRAVCQGIGTSQGNLKLMPIPVGRQPVSNYLNQWQHQLPRGIMLMGLGGSLSQKYRVGDLVLYRDCGDLQEQQWYSCDYQLSELVFQKVGNRVSWGRGITSDRVISLAEEKCRLGEKYHADIVDMEGIAILNWCRSLDIPLVMLRVISDSCQQDLPDLTAAFDRDGNLSPLKLTYQLLKNPPNSIHLIRSSLQSLMTLQKLAKDLFN
ncbi:MAG: purine phosphorylase [Cyanobacteria bacterium P01_G01_bin.49]